METLGDSEGQGSLVGKQFMGWQRVRHNLATEQQQPSLWSGEIVGIYLYLTHLFVSENQI